MKASSVFFGLLTAAFLAIPAGAQDEAKPAPAPADAPAADHATEMARRREELIRRFDKNGDGKLDEEEKAAAKEALRMEGGGRGPGGPDGEKRRTELLKRFDKNGDGKLDDEERAEMEKARQLIQRNGGMDRFRQEILKRFDKNGDGVLDESERAEARKFRLEMIKKFDKNGDGKLDDEERAEALKAFMAEKAPTPEAAPVPATPAKKE